MLTQHTYCLAAYEHTMFMSQDKKGQQRIFWAKHNLCYKVWHHVLASAEQGTCGEPVPCLIEYVIVAFWICELNNPRPLQQIGPDSCPADPAILIELKLNKFSKPGRVVISDCLGIAKGFQQWV